MKNFLFLVLFCMALAPINAQGDNQKVQIEDHVNKEVWKPFKNSYEKRDWETFNSLHTDDILRVHDGGIRQGQEYKDDIKTNYQRVSERKTQIDFVMERRMYKEDLGYEVGFYRVIYKEKGKEDRMSYGRFHVVLKNIDGTWRIAQDWDSNSFNGRPIGEKDFDESKILDLN